MKKNDEDAIRWAINKYWREKTDADLALGLKVTEEKIKKMREELGYYRDKVGKESLKQFAQRYLLEMSEEDKMEFMKRLSPELVWKMAEGQAATSGTLDISTEPIKIDISHQLLKAYGTTAAINIGPEIGGSTYVVPEYSEVSGESERPGK